MDTDRKSQQPQVSEKQTQSLRIKWIEQRINGSEKNKQKGPEKQETEK